MRTVSVEAVPDYLGSGGKLPHLCGCQLLVFADVVPYGNVPHLSPPYWNLLATSLMIAA